MTGDGARIDVEGLPAHPVKSAALVLSFNGVDILRECLPSMLFEGAVVVVDNGSTDETADYARSMGAGLVRLERNVGLGRALNVAARSIQATTLILSNNDVIVHDGAFRHLHALLEEDPTIGLAAPVLLNPDGTVQEFGNDMHVSGLAVRPRWRIGPILDTFYQSGCVTAVRREEFLALGGYGEVLEWFYEDVDLAWRYRNAGLRVVVDDRARCVHMLGATLGSSVRVGRTARSDERHRRRTYFGNRNVLLVFLRNAPLGQLALQLPAIVVRQCLEALAAFARGDRPLAAVYLRAWRDACGRASRALDDVRRSRMPLRRRSTLEYVQLQIGESVARVRDLVTRR